MHFKKNRILWHAFVLAVFAVCSGWAGTQRISIFRGVDIPFDFKAGDIFV